MCRVVVHFDGRFDSQQTYRQKLSENKFPQDFSTFLKTLSGCTNKKLRFEMPWEAIESF